MIPIYEYECENCAYRFELKSRFDEHVENPRCPICQGKVRQLYSPAGLLFKGSGFYITESRSNSNLPPGESTTEKVDNVKKEEKKADKTDGDKKEVGKTDSTNGGRKEEGKADKVESGRKEERKYDKVQKSKDLDNK